MMMLMVMMMMLLLGGNQKNEISIFIFIFILFPIQHLHPISLHLSWLMTLVVFGYGSLVWKVDRARSPLPPPHTVGKKQGYVKGFIRRFAQSSDDHRGVPEKPGRVVTLVTAQDWEGITGERTSEEDAKVWGVGWEIDGSMEAQVKADLDHREKSGYTVERVDIYNTVNGVETVIVPDATIYVGKVNNEAFVGSEPLDFLARRILSCHGPSGPNREYLYRLAGAVRGLVGGCQDTYLFELEEAVRQLEEEESTRIKSLPADS